MGVVDDSFGQPLKLEERASAPLAGGIMMNGYQCGMLWGAALAAGAEAYRQLGSGPQAEVAAVITSQRLVEAFRAKTKNEINCLEITDMTWQEANQALPILKFFLKGGPIGCLRLTARYAKAAFSEINTVFTQDHFKAPSPPVSCAAMLAQKLGVSEMHTVMAAGFAGGIGLSGGACGALGAAIWILAMKSGDQGASGLDFQNPQARETIDRFLKCSDYEFECAEIVGRSFDGVEDHAAYLRQGGCSEIIEELASS